jgi:hypothetical protein
MIYIIILSLFVEDNCFFKYSSFYIIYQYTFTVIIKMNVMVLHNIAEDSLCQKNIVMGSVINVENNSVPILAFI